jgi:cbb3-type cytochrome oxidase maturation protein
VDVLLYLIPAALLLGGLGLAAFLWALKSGQFDDLDGAAHRILFEDEDEDGNRSGPAAVRPKGGTRPMAEPGGADAPDGAREEAPGAGRAPRGPLR